MMHVMDPKMNIVNQLINCGWYTEGTVWRVFAFQGHALRMAQGASGSGLPVAPATQAHIIH
jgi:hypothetical protein